jgi:hypothetical protein
MANLKALVDSAAGLIRGTYTEPLQFSISGHYIIDIPAATTVLPPDNVVADLIAAKIAAFEGISGLATNVSDELLATPNVDSVNSTGVIVGPNKHTVILPGGTLLTNPIAAIPGTYTVYLHYYGFILYRAAVDPSSPASPTPGPSKMLYNYDPLVPGFVPFQTSTFTVSIAQTLTPFTNISTPLPDTRVPTIAIPASFRMKFVNTSTEAFHLSDWILLYG